MFYSSMNRFIFNFTILSTTEVPLAHSYMPHARRVNSLFVPYHVEEDAQVGKSRVIVTSGGSI